MDEWRVSDAPYDATHIQTKNTTKIRFYPSNSINAKSASNRTAIPEQIAQ